MVSTTIDVVENIQTVLNKQSTKLNVRIPVEPHRNNQLNPVEDKKTRTRKHKLHEYNTKTHALL